MKKSIIAIFVIIIIITGLSIWFKTKDSESNDHLTLYGNVDIRQVSLAFEPTGRIQELYVEEGDNVKKGDILAKLNTDSLKIQAKQAEAQLDIQKHAILEQETGTRPEQIAQAEGQLLVAHKQLEQANSDLERLQGLNNLTIGQAVSKKELDNAINHQAIAVANVKIYEAALEFLEKGERIEKRAATKARYDAAEANLNLIHYQISQSELYAPSDAIVRSRLQEIGDMTNAQKTVYTLALIDPKWVRVYVTGKDLGLIKIGDDAEIFQDSMPNKPIIGKIGYISSIAEFTPKSVQTEDIRTTLVYEVRIYVKDPTDQLKMGQPVTVKIAKSHTSQE